MRLFCLLVLCNHRICCCYPASDRRSILRIIKSTESVLFFNKRTVFQVKLVLDSPQVGENLYDHSGLMFYYGIREAAALDGADKLLSNRKV